MKIYPSKLKGVIGVPSSKSLSHRYVIAASLSKKLCHLDNVLESDDLEATINALKAFGLKIEGNQYYLKEFIGGDKEIDCNESGSTLRFMIPFCMMFKDRIILNGKGQLINRPIDVYERVFAKEYTFKSIGKNNLPLEVKGPIKGGIFNLEADISSQFITGLLFVLPLLKEDSIINLTTPLQSKGYVDMTIDVLEQFGIRIGRKNRHFLISGNQEYKKINHTVEGDYSSAAFFIVAGLLGKKIKLKGLNPDSSQADKCIVEYVNKMGANVAFINDELVINPCYTKSAILDLKDCPDLGPILFVLASLSNGTTIFENTDRLKLKESNRVFAMYDNLKKLGADIVLNDNQVIITGIKMLKGNVKLKTYGDHRIAMALAICSSRIDGYIELDNYDVVSKSYPDFFKDFEKLGGIIKE